MKMPGVSSEIVAVWLLATAAFVFPVLAVIAPLGITVEFIILGVSLLPFAIRERAWRHLPRPAIALPAVLVAWAAISTLWAHDPHQAATASLRLLGVFLAGLAILAAGLALPATALRPFRLALLAGVGLVAVPLLVNELVEHLFTDFVHLPDNPAVSHPVKRGIAVLTLLVWPVRLVLRRRVPGPVLTLLTGAILAVTVFGEGSTSRIAAGVGIIVALAVSVAPRRGPVAAGAALVLVALSMPLATHFLPSPHYTFQHWTFLAPSAHHRLTIWGFTTQRIAEKPLLGWGMNASRGFPGGDDEVVVKRHNAEGLQIHELTEPMLPLHPHNALLQLWLELGAAGVILFCTFVIWLLSRVTEAPAAQRGDITALTVAAYIVAASSFGFWQGWWQGSLWMTAAFAILALRDGASAKDLNTTSHPSERNESLRS